LVLNDNKEATQTEVQAIVTRDEEDSLSFLVLSSTSPAGDNQDIQLFAEELLGPLHAVDLSADESHTEDGLTWYSRATVPWARLQQVIAEHGLGMSSNYCYIIH
jgi:hypothetical protein